ncbi:hypothetical protein PL373_13590 [Tenacibaculum maritimum]|nr:hypothetical protein [Tenacibaculum maritimum]MDB0602162.1 hypothetical protein [Tenacibaculum maritimum]MDB0613838.1 hypothetical protein [Tenacibaculum maritimum]
MSLFATYKQELRAMYPNRLDNQEWRGTQLGLLRAIQAMTNHPESIVSQDIETKANDSEGRVFKIPVMKDTGDVNITAVRSCTIGDLDNESELVDVTWLTMVANLHMIKEQHRKNEISYFEDFDRKLRRIERSFGKSIENNIFSKLDTEKSTIYNSTLIGSKYPLVGDAVQVAAAQQELFFNDLDAVQIADDFDLMEHVIVGSTNLMPSVRHYINQGNSNDETLNYQFNDKTFTFSNRVVDGGGVLATGFAMPHGSLGLLTRINADARSGNTTTDGTEWSVERLNRLGLDVGVQYKSTCEDVSNVQGLEHLQATKVERWQLSLDVCLLTPYNSDPANVAGGIKKFEFLS